MNATPYTTHDRVTPARTPSLNARERLGYSQPRATVQARRDGRQTRRAFRCGAMRGKGAPLLAADAERAYDARRLPGLRECNEMTVWGSRGA